MGSSGVVNFTGMDHQSDKIGPRQCIVSNLTRFWWVVTDDGSWTINPNFMSTISRQPDEVILSYWGFFDGYVTSLANEVLTSWAEGVVSFGTERVTTHFVKNSSQHPWNVHQTFILILSNRRALHTLDKFYWRVYHQSDDFLKLTSKNHQNNYVSLPNSGHSDGFLTNFWRASGPKYFVCIMIPPDDPLKSHLQLVHTGFTRFLVDNKGYDISLTEPFVKHKDFW